MIEAGANLGFAAGCNRGADGGLRRAAPVPEPRRGPGAGFREAIERPLADGRGWAAWQGLVTAEGGTRRSTPAAASSTSPGSPGRAAPGSRSTGGRTNRPRAEDRAGLRLGRLPGDPARASSSELGGFAGGVLPLPRGRRPVAAAAARGRAPRGRAGRPGRPRLRVRQGAGQVAPAGAQPLGDADPHLPGGPARAARAGAAGDRAGAGPGLDRRRLVRPEARSPGATCFAGAAAAAAGAARGSRRRGRSAPASSPRGLTADLDSPYLGGAGRSRALRAALRAYWSLVLALLGSAVRGAA